MMTRLVFLLDKLLMIAVMELRREGHHLLDWETL
jgi:hypothetical protein